MALTDYTIYFLGTQINPEGNDDEVAVAWLSVVYSHDKHGYCTLSFAGLLVVSAEASWIGILLIIQPITKNAINAKARSAGKGKKSMMIKATAK